MTTRRQSEANRVNAQGSTGPKSEAGKRKVAQNARRHGLTTPPPWDRVAAWYQILMNNPHALPDPFSRDPRDQATLRLAEAEAQVERSTAAEGEHLFDMQERIRQDEENVPLLERVVERMLKRGIDYEDHDTLRLLAQNNDDPFMSGAAKILAHSSPTRPAAMRKTMKTFMRYRRDAESARRSALKTWMQVNA